MPETTIDIAALYAAVDARRRAAGQSWRELATMLSLSRATFARMARGQRPDVDSFATLLRWLGVPADSFMRSHGDLPTGRHAAGGGYSPDMTLSAVWRPGTADRKMHLTVVGGGAGTRMADEANSGYLVTRAGVAFLLDCGPGVATRLRRYVPLLAIAGVAISHMHFDNWYDLLPLAIMAYGDTVSPFVWEEHYPPFPSLRAPLPVYLPPGGTVALRAAMDAVIRHYPLVGKAFATALDPREYRAGESFTMEPFTVRPVGPVKHDPGPCFGLRVTDGEATLGYTGDSAMCDALDDIARDANLFLCDATGITRGVRRSRHLSADEAGMVAARAGARHLVLTHTASTTPSWRDALARAASAHYAGTVSVARDGDTFTLTPEQPAAGV